MEFVTREEYDELRQLVEQLRKERAELKAMVVSVFQQEQALVRDEMAKGWIHLRKRLEESERKVEVLERMVEQCCAAAVAQHPRKPQTGVFFKQQQLQWAKILADMMEETFDMEELRGLCADFYIDFETLAGNQKTGKIRAIVKHFFRRKTLHLLAQELQEQRPLVQWPLTAVEATLW